MSDVSEGIQEQEVVKTIRRHCSCQMDVMANATILGASNTVCITNEYSAPYKSAVAVETCPDKSSIGSISRSP
jgi:hypothetical protein